MKKNLILLFIGIILSLQSSSLEAKMTIDEKLSALRNAMRSEGVDAYIVVTDDEHQSEYVSKYDERRAWLTGFTGSAGTAVVTLTKSGLWTDNRYTIQANEQLKDTPWEVKISSVPGTPSISNWLILQLTSGSKVAQWDKFTSISSWQARETALKRANITFLSPKNELIDKIWPSNEREPQAKSKIEIHDIKFAGKTWQQKVAEVQLRMKNKNADLFVVTALDEVAWLFNMRAWDIPYNPMFFAYAIINRENNTHRLYIDPSRINTELSNHLEGVTIRNYNLIATDITDFSNRGYKIWVSPYSSYGIYNAVSNKNLLIDDAASPVRSVKAVKNPVEIENIRRCQIRDSAARIRHMHWMEKEMKKGSVLTEMTIADKLEAIQAEDNLFKGLSFDSISAVGANAAIVHYSTIEGVNLTLTKDRILLLDAGAQYQDCTSDITRTHHYGQPSAEIKFMYTKVLQGSIDLLNIVFPANIYGDQLDILARSPFWKSGIDFGHGTGHGIGYFLSVHEDPPNTAYYGRGTFDEPFVEGMVQSDEPGYYKQGEYGIRLETDIEVVKAKFQQSDKPYLKFESLTFVPFDENLIDPCMLSNEQVEWLNQYNKDIREKVGPLLNQEDKAYLESKTMPFKYSHSYSTCKTFLNGSNQSIVSIPVFVFALLSSIFYLF